MLPDPNVASLAGPIQDAIPSPPLLHPLLHPLPIVPHQQYTPGGCRGLCDSLPLLVIPSIYSPHLPQNYMSIVLYSTYSAVHVSLCIHMHTHV